jgi:glycolate oxidase iron-sulfur subunit
MVGDAFISHIDLCLGCRACESACPSSVPYGHLLEGARAEVAEAKKSRGSLSEFFLRSLLNQVFRRPLLLGMSLAFARWVRDSGLARLAFDTRLVKGRFRFALALLLATRSPFAKADRRLKSYSLESHKTAKHSDSIRRVAMLRGCVMEGLFRETNRATERVLERNNCELMEVRGQVCCGALHAHAGQIETAKELAKKNIKAFLSSGCDRVIVNAAGCGAAMKEYAALLATDDAWREQAREFSSRVRDISEFLIEIGFALPAGRIERRVTYDAPCHLFHAQRIMKAPVEVLRSIPGIELIALRDSESCCGGAGIYNLQHPEMSREILGGKIGAIRDTGAEIVTTANPGCIMQIGAGILENDMDVDVAHPIELLDAAYGGTDIAR